MAIAPIAGHRALAERVEQAMVVSHPPIRPDMAFITPQQLFQSSVVQLASATQLTSDVLSVQAARNAGAKLLLQGEILDADIELQPQAAQNFEKTDWNNAFFKKKDASDKSERILMSWRVIDVGTSQTVASASFNLETKQAIKQYPELAFVQHDQTQLLISASARESWKTVAPYVTKDHVRLAVPWLQPGAFTVRRGVAAARKGDWQTAEEKWARVTKIFSFNAAAHHNLALARAAREDFPAAKQQLRQASGLFAYRLPSETLLWLDQQHRYHNTALGLGTPAEGWAFPEAEPQPKLQPVSTVDLETLPWWTALPFAKPPGWTWQGWLTQPWAL